MFSSLLDKFAAYEQEYVMPESFTDVLKYIPKSKILCIPCSSKKQIESLISNNMTQVVFGNIDLNQLYYLKLTLQSDMASLVTLRKMDILQADFREFDTVMLPGYALQMFSKKNQENIISRMIGYVNYIMIEYYEYPCEKNAVAEKISFKNDVIFLRKEYSFKNNRILLKKRYHFQEEFLTSSVNLYPISTTVFEQLSEKKFIKVFDSNGYDEGNHLDLKRHVQVFKREIVK